MRPGKPESTPETDIFWNRAICHYYVLDRYLRRCKFEHGTYLTVTRNGNRLSVEMTGQGSIEVCATGEREFYPSDIEAQFVFSDSGTAPAKSVVLTSMNQGRLNAPHSRAAA